MAVADHAAPHHAAHRPSPLPPQSSTTPVPVVPLTPSLKPPRLSATHPPTSTHIPSDDMLNSARASSRFRKPRNILNKNNKNKNSNNNPSSTVDVTTVPPGGTNTVSVGASFKSDGDAHATSTRTETINTETTNMTASSAGSSAHRPSIEAALRHASDAGHHKPKVKDLAGLASSVLQRPRHDQHTTVRYIAQIDLADHMVKRSKVGPSTAVYVLLESTNLSVSKSQTASARYRVNVRATPVTVDVPARELRIYVPASGKAKLLRLVMESGEVAERWKRALQNALNSDIKEYYTFSKVLGSGAYGEVVKAVHNVTQETRAVKIIQRGDNTKSKEHLDQEIQVMKSISHPNIVQTYQIFDLRRTIYIVMEYVSGGDLFDFVAQHDCLTEKHSSETMRSIFRAVEYLHCNSIVHRDLKPENILCANDSWPLQIKLSDFGFANFLDPREDTDDTMRTQVGTVYFMAPEIITNKGHGPAVDLWACGVILYTILTGRLPFPGRNTTEYLTNVVRGRILFPAVLWKGISADAQSLVKGLLNLDPRIRLTALGALQHRWIQWPDATYGQNEIRRDRSNLHSKHRRLFKARKAIIAVAMANKFKATIPQVVDAMGDQTKKVAGVIEGGVKKTADGITTGVMQMGEGLAEGTKNIGENTKKMAASVAGGTKKVAEGIGTGVKKTVDGVESGARKVGHGVKKTVDGVETGLKKTVDGVETGLKKTADGIGQGVKKTAEGAKKAADGFGHGVKKTADGIGHGVKETGHKFKRGVDRIRIDRSNKDTDGSHSQMNTSFSQSSSSRRGGGGGPHFPFRRRNPSFSAVSRSDDENDGANVRETMTPVGGSDASGAVTMMSGDTQDRDQQQQGTTEAGAAATTTTTPPGRSRQNRRLGKDGRRKRFGRDRKHGNFATTAANSKAGNQQQQHEQEGTAVNNTPDAGSSNSNSGSKQRRRSGSEREVDSAGEYESALEEHSETEDGWQRNGADGDDFLTGGGGGAAAGGRGEGTASPILSNRFVPTPAESPRRLQQKLKQKLKLKQQQQEEEEQGHGRVAAAGGGGGGTGMGLVGGFGRGVGAGLGGGGTTTTMGDSNSTTTTKPTTVTTGSPFMFPSASLLKPGHTQNQAQAQAHATQYHQSQEQGDTTTTATPVLTGGGGGGVKGARAAARNIPLLPLQQLPERSFPSPSPPSPSPISPSPTASPLRGGGRPMLAPLSGLTMGLSDESMAGSSAREQRQQQRQQEEDEDEIKEEEEEEELGMGFGLGDMGMGGGALGGMNNKQVELMRKTTMLMMGLGAPSAAVSKR